jgi:hypothetical protein
LLIAQSEQSVQRIAALAALGAGNEAAKMHATAVVVRPHRERVSATARDEKDARVGLLFYDPPLAKVCSDVGAGRLSPHGRPTAARLRPSSACACSIAKLFFLVAAIWA